MMNCSWLKGHKYSKWEIKQEYDAIIRGEDGKVKKELKFIEQRRICSECNYVDVNIQKLEIGSIFS